VVYPDSPSYTIRQIGQPDESYDDLAIKRKTLLGIKIFKFGILPQDSSLLPAFLG